MTNKELAGYLRCSNEPGSDKCGTDCPYFTMELIPDEYKQIQPDIVVEGVGYWSGCDYAKICIDAADALERVGVK